MSDSDAPPIPAKYTPEQVEQIWADFLLEGARYGDAEDVQQALERSTDVNAADASGRTALHMASANGHTDVMRMLLDAGANTEHRNDSGNTPLHWACVGGHAEAVRLLLRHGGDPSSLNHAERTPLDGALEDEAILRAFQEHRMPAGGGADKEQKEQMAQNAQDPPPSGAAQDQEAMQVICAKVESVNVQSEGGQGG